MNRREYLIRAREWAQLGSANPAAKLTPELVTAIRRRRVRHSRQHSIPAIARDLGLPAPTVRDVVDRRTWSHIA